MKTLLRKIFCICLALIICSLTLTSCMFNSEIYDDTSASNSNSNSNKNGTPVRMSVEYLENKENNCFSSLNTWDFNVYLHWKDGTKTKTYKYDILNKDKKLAPANSTKTFNFKSTEYNLETSIDINIPEYKVFPYTREEFCELYYKNMKLFGITKYSMILDKDNNGNITKASFKAPNGSYWYFLEFTNYEDKNSPYFCTLKLDTNVQYDKDEMETMKLVLMLCTMPDDSYPVATAYKLMNANDGELTAKSVSYDAVFQYSNIHNSYVYYMWVRRIQSPVYVGDIRKEEDDKFSIPGLDTETNDVYSDTERVTETWRESGTD